LVALALERFCQSPADAGSVAGDQDGLGADLHNFDSFDYRRVHAVFWGVGTEKIETYQKETVENVLAAPMFHRERGKELRV
jgi:hypothetical protein